MNNLRQLIRHVLLENEETLKKWNSNSKDAIKRELSKLGIYTISRGENDEYELGRGAYNRVIDAVYNGKRCAVRLSNSERELKAYLDFMEYKDILIQKYAKHFPQIYKTFEITLGLNTKTLQSKLYGIVVEILDPLPPALYREFDLGSGLDGDYLDYKIRRSRIQLLKNEDLIADLAEKNESIHGDKEKLVAAFMNNIFPYLDDLVGKNYEVAQELFEDKLGFFSPDFIADLLNVIEYYAIPTRGWTNKPKNAAVAKYNPSSKVREFYEFLLALKNAGMTWVDLHIDNYMMRKGTGDLVVVDPGLFAQS
jgi:hypothetical protein